MNGLAITIIVGQLPKLFGFSTEGDTFVDDVVAFFQNLDQTNTTTLLVGLGTLRSSPRPAPRLEEGPRRARRRRGGHRGLGRLLSRGRGGEDRGARSRRGAADAFHPVDQRRVTSRRWWPRPSASSSSRSTDTIATSSSFAARRGDEVDADREMIAVGASNVGAGLFQGFAISVSGSRTAVAEQAGAKTQATGLVGAGLVIVMLGSHPGAAQGPPPVGAGRRRHHGGDLAGGHRRPPPLRARPQDGAVSVPGRHGRGRLLRRAAGHPHRRHPLDPAVLPPELVAAGRRARRRARAQGLARRGAVPRWPSRSRTSSIFRWEAPLFFANAGIFRQRVRKLVVEQKPLWIVLQCEAITDIDVTAAEMLKQLDTELNTKGHPLRLRRAARAAAGQAQALRAVGEPASSGSTCSRR